MIDFTKCEVNKFKAYGGANGNKINIRYDGKEYMLKFPLAPGKTKAMSYTNGCISEYLACRDFTESSKKLMEFARLKNTCIDSEQNGFGTELSTIIAAIEEQSLGSCVGFFEYCADQKRDTQNEIHGHSLWPDQLIREFPLGIDDIIGKCKQEKAYGEARCAGKTRNSRANDICQNEKYDCGIQISGHHPGCKAYGPADQ